MILEHSTSGLDLADRWGNTALDDAKLAGARRVVEYLEKVKKERSEDQHLDPDLDPVTSAQYLEQLKRERSTAQHLDPDLDPGASAQCPSEREDGGRA